MLLVGIVDAMTHVLLASLRNHPSFWLDGASRQTKAEELSGRAQLRFKPLKVIIGGTWRFSLHVTRRKR